MNKKIETIANQNSDIYEIFLNSEKFSTKWTSYFQVYDQIFKKYKNKKITFVEVGVANGGSLFIWKKYFSEDSRIIGIDLNPNARKLEKHGFEIYIGNQTKKSFWENFYNKVGKIDILLDDGGHKNIQQVSTVHYSLPHIKDDGIIVVEDTHTSFIKKEFGNPSKYSFINFCNLIVSSIHKRCAVFEKKLNFYSKKIFSINFYESIVVFNIDTNKCKISKSVQNNAKNEWALDFRNNEYFDKTKKIINTKFTFLNNSKFFKKIIRKIFYKNFIFRFYENIKLKKIFNEVEKE
jgi:hypothetical protein